MRIAMIVISISAWMSLCSIVDSSSSCSNSNSVSHNPVTRQQSTLFGVRSSLITAVDNNNSFQTFTLDKSPNELSSEYIPTVRVLLNLRGGEDNSEDEDEEEEKEEEEEEEDEEVVAIKLARKKTIADTALSKTHTLPVQRDDAKHQITMDIAMDKKHLQKPPLKIVVRVVMLMWRWRSMKKMRPLML
mmetsp:Transcript_62793/g.71089  ORF Transcript_62793/g.71089 Transcript_62793/m.71089 type:complete len:188 (+) Transcript_62793:96-659(+)